MIRTLATLARGKRYDLVCPECGGPIVLAHGLYWCDGRSLTANT